MQVLDIYVLRSMSICFIPSFFPQLQCKGVILVHLVPQLGGQNIDVVFFKNCI